MIGPSLANLPAYVPGKPIEDLERELGISGAIKLASNENLLGPSPKGMAALKRGIKGLERYPDGSGVLLKEALSQKWQVKPNQIVIGNGSDEIIALLAHALLLPGEEAIMAEPSFSIYRLTTLSSYAKPVLIPLTQGRHDLIKMAKAVTKKTRLIFICNPNNPTGTIVYQKEVAHFLSQLPEGVSVVFDEAYGEYVTDPNYPVSIQFLKKRFPIIFLRTFSKIYGLAGLRIGYGVGHPDLIDLLNRIRLPFNTNTLAQQAALAALSDVDHVKATLEQNEKGKRYLYNAFDAMGIDYIPTEANFIYFAVSDQKKAIQKGRGGDAMAKGVYEALLHQGIIIRPMEGPFLRVTIGKMGQMQRFIRSLKKSFVACSKLHID
jgi:histidinol-phosphate aminotransferase